MTNEEKLISLLAQQRFDLCTPVGFATGQDEAQGISPVHRL